MNKYISWRRVSTFKQNRSGLGLEAQKEIIRYFVERDKGELIADYSECYTGKELSGCVELRKAMAHAKREGGILVVAKSDRFRNCQEALGILTEMGEGNIEFCDLPHSDRFTLTLFWALAEREALITSIRTRQALAVKKAQGAKLGAANENYRATRARKDKEQIKREHMKKGQTKNLRHLESPDVKAFFKVLRNVFPKACADKDPMKWNWAKIHTKDGTRQKVLRLMADYKDFDDTLFRKWDFTDIDSTALQIKLAKYIYALRRSINTYKEHKTHDYYEQ